MDKCELNEVGLSEVQWLGKGETVLGNYTMFYSGGVEAGKVVSVVLKNDVKCLTKVECCSDRLMFVKISAKPIDIVLVQVYIPTTNNDDDEIEKLYDKISEILHHEGRGQVNVIVMGDFNSIVGEESTDKVVGPFALCKRNARGKMLIDFCKQHDLVVMNMWFKKRKMKLYTWKSPGDRNRYKLITIL
jgi:Endonuclease/Exonuclease/phosphatase family.